MAEQDFPFSENGSFTPCNANFPLEEDLSGKSRESDEHMLGEYSVLAVFAASCIVTRQI